jgi:beta-lactamase regulating signal transducer with metallopeptidase domain
MLAALFQASLRSLILAIVVWAGLRIFRIHNVFSQRYAWTAVLAGSLLMPLVLPFTAHWLSIPFVRIPAPAALDRLPSALALAPSTSAPAPPAPGERQLTPVQRAPISQQKKPTANAEPIDARADSLPVTRALATDNSAQTPPPPARISSVGWAVLLYFLIAGALLLRLLFGLVSALRLWHSSTPVLPGGGTQIDAGLNLRSSCKVSTPVTIGSGIVLPADYTSWAEEKLRIVLAHETTHVNHHDFHLQILASFYAAVMWFSPLGWWLKHKLSDLGEAISDCSGLNAASNRSAYAQVLLEFAAAPRPTLIGVAMARHSSISRRIDRFFDDRAFRQAFATNRRTLAATLLVPMVMFAAATVVRVEAAAPSLQQAAPKSSQAPATSQSHPDSAAPAVAPDAGPGTEPAASPAPSVAPAQPDPPAWPARVEVPAVHVNVPAVQVDAPPQHIDVPAVHVDVPVQHVDIPAVHVDVPPKHIEVPASYDERPADAPKPQGRATGGSTGELFAMLTNFGHSLFSHASMAAVENAAGQSEATFDRNLTFNGKLDLSVATGSGNITFTRGTANQVHIHGVVKAGRNGDPAQVQQIAANPPIEQEGNKITIGGHQENLHDISISYEIEAPADTTLRAASGSGNIADTGVGEGAQLTTGSGNITATGIEGGFKTETGSGNIAIDGTGEGDAKAQTGSGDIDLKGVHGALVAQTGSGRIKAEGTPSSPWKIRSGSGSIELVTGNAPMNLSASTGSGSISTNKPMTMQTANRHHVEGQLNGGGPQVKVDAGSGTIRIE